MAAVLRKTALTLAHFGELLGMQNLDPDPGKIFVTGGSGVIGHRVAARMLHAGYPQVRLGTSRIDSLKNMKEKGAEIVVFSWDNEETYARASNRSS
jgi:NADP-dependent 3-hydroxy acid dehydrogenase YdfG